MSNRGEEGFLVIRCAEGEPFRTIAIPNAHSDGADGLRWIAEPNLDSGWTREELAAIAHDRGGRLEDGA